MRLAFRRSEAGRFKRLKERWRRPGGIHNKMREGKKGILPKIGWKKPETEEIPIISNLSELNGLKTKEIIISSKIGMKKRLELEKFCAEKKIKILNFKKLVKKKKIVKKKIVTEKKSETKKTPVKTETVKKNIEEKEVKPKIKENTQSPKDASVTKNDGVKIKQVAKEETKLSNTSTNDSVENKTETKK